MIQSVENVKGRSVECHSDPTGLGMSFFAGMDNSDTKRRHKHVEEAWQRADDMRKANGAQEHVCQICGGAFHRNLKVTVTCGREACRYELKKRRNRVRMANGYKPCAPTKRIPCATCGRMFLPPKHTVVCCSPECQRSREILRKSVGRRGKKLCEVCGEPFFPYRPTQKCCGADACVKESNARRRRAAERRRYAGEKEEAECHVIELASLDKVKFEGLPFAHAICSPMG